MMTLSKMLELIDEYEEENKDEKNAGRLCIVLMALCRWGFKDVADCLARDEFQEAKKCAKLTFENKT